MFNFAIALGALFGSLVVQNLALAGVLWLAAGLVALTSAAVAGTRPVMTRDGATSP